MKKNESLLFVREIIKRVSRTFAISIALLPGNLGKAVLVGYLLCRIADTIEDDSSTPSIRRQALLTLFSECFNNPEKLHEFTTEIACINGDKSYLELLNGTKMVFDVLYALPSKSAQIVWDWTQKLTLGMHEFVEKYPAGIHIKSMQEFHRYCYYVAGTVGHMLTELFYYHSAFINNKTHNKLLLSSEAFGEALQIVNILKDIAWDCEFENDVFIPEEILIKNGSNQANILSVEYRAQNYTALKTIIELADNNIAKALEYFYTLPRMAITIRLFCLVPIIFAIATLREIKNTNVMLAQGGTVKISRKEVKSLLSTCFIVVISNKLTARLASKVSIKPYLFF